MMEFSHNLHLLVIQHCDRIFVQSCLSDSRSKDEKNQLHGILSPSRMRVIIFRCFQLRIPLRRKKISFISLHIQQKFTLATEVFAYNHSFDLIEDTNFQLFWLVVFSYPFPNSENSSSKQGPEFVKNGLLFIFEFLFLENMEYIGNIIIL